MKVFFQSSYSLQSQGMTVSFPSCVLPFVLKDALTRLNSQEIMSGEEDNYDSLLDDAITYCEEDVKGGVFQIIESLYERTGKSRSLENH